MSLTFFLGLLNYEAVLIFGVLVAAAFAGIEFHFRQRRDLFFFLVLTSVLQVFVYQWLGMSQTAKLYPFIIHLPLILYLILHEKKQPLMALSAVLAAYLCCQTRRWLGSLTLYVLGNTNIWYLTQILVTLPLLYLLIHYVAPPVAHLMKQGRRAQFLFGLVPFFYYSFDYATTVYSDLLYAGTRAAVEFIPSVLSASFFVFAVLFAGELEKRYQSTEEQRLLAMQVNQATRDLENLRESQTLTAMHRHDLRHHLRYLETCLLQQDTSTALSYIRKIDQTLSAISLKRFCENETVNLILSSFAHEAEICGVSFQTEVVLPANYPEHIDPIDLCIILGNLLDNAMHAAKAAEDPRFIRVDTRVQNSKVFFQIQNSYGGSVVFHQQFPISMNPNHGLGTKSVLITVQKNHGLIDYSASHGVFNVRLVL